MCTGTLCKRFQIKFAHVFFLSFLKNSFCKGSLAYPFWLCHRRQFGQITQSRQNLWVISNYRTVRRLGEKRLKIISVLSVCGKKTSCEINLSKITFRYGNEHNINFWYFRYKFLQLEVFSLILTKKKNMTLFKCYLRLWTLETHWSLAMSEKNTFTGVRKRLVDF